MFLDLLLDVGFFGSVLLLSDFVPNLKDGLLGFLARRNRAQILLPRVVDFVFQFRVLILVQIGLPGLHRFGRWVQIQNASSTGTRQ